MPHDELGEGEQQEELYLVVEGRARFACDGEPFELRPGELLFVRPGVRREAVALKTPTNRNADHHGHCEGLLRCL